MSDTIVIVPELTDEQVTELHRAEIDRQMGNHRKPAAFRKADRQTKDRR